MNVDQLVADLRGREPDQADQRQFDAEMKLPMPGSLKRVLQRVAQQRGVSLRHFCREVLADAAMAHFHTTTRPADPMPRPGPASAVRNDDDPPPGALGTTESDRLTATPTTQEEAK